MRLEEENVSIISYRVNAKINPVQLCQLFEQTSWADGRLPADVEKMLEHTAFHVSAWDNGRLIGFVRSITDTVYRALVDDVIVDAAYRGKGIGTELIQRIDSELENIDEVFLGCGDDVAAFYRRFGYTNADHLCLKKVNKDP